MCKRGRIGLAYMKLEKLIKELKLKLSLEEVQQCFALSKQMIINESEQSREYLYLTFIEWLEFITRLNYCLLQKNKKPDQFLELDSKDSDKEDNIITEQTERQE